MFKGLDGYSSGSTTRHPNCHPPCLERAIVPILVPNVVVTGARWYPNCVSPRNAIHHGEFWRSQGLDSHSSTITVSIHHLPQPMSHSPPPVTHSPTFLPLPAPHLVRSNTCRLGLQPPRCRRPPTERGSARRTPRPPERRGRERSKEREHRKGKVGLR